MSDEIVYGRIRTFKAPVQAPFTAERSAVVLPCGVALLR